MDQVVDQRADWLLRLAALTLGQAARDQLLNVSAGDLEVAREQVLRDGIPEVLGALVALCRIFGQRLPYDLFKLWRDIRILRSQRRHLRLAHQLHRLVVRLTVEKALTGQHLVGQNTDGKDV